MNAKKQSQVEAQVEIKKDKRNLQYYFTREELLMLGKSLSEAQLTYRQLDDDRKMVVDQWKSKISSKEAEITDLSNKVSRGYDYRDIPVEIRLNEPIGKKTIIRLDTNEVVCIEDLTDSERQRTLKFESEDSQKESQPEE